jgi:hypothetical protein
MHTRITCLLIFLVLPGPALVQSSAVTTAGEWLGRLAAGAVELRIVLSVEWLQDGGLRATFDSVDQGVKMPVERITYENRTLRFAIPTIDGSYEGTMTAGGDRSKGLGHRAAGGFR